MNIFHFNYKWQSSAHKSVRQQANWSEKLLVDAYNKLALLVVSLDEHIGGII